MDCTRQKFTNNGFTNLVGNLYLCFSKPGSKLTSVVGYFQNA